MKNALIITLAIVACLPCAVLAEDVDLQVVHRIKAEAFHNSQVMNYVQLLTDMNGSRLSGSPGYFRAAESAAAAMRAIGIDDADLVAWGKFGRSWSYRNASIRMLTPAEAPLNGVPMAWSMGTGGAVRGKAVFAPVFPNPDHPDLYDLEKVAERIEAYKAQHSGSLRGQFVLVHPYRKFELPTEATAVRLDDLQLAELVMAETPGSYEPATWPRWKTPLDPEEASRQYRSIPLDVKVEYWERELAILNRLYGFLAEEGVAAILQVDNRGDGGAIFADSYGSWVPDTSKAPPTMTLSPEHYNRILRLVKRDHAVELEIDIDAEFHDENVDGKNVIASIPGGRKRNEIVMIGGHLDSWHGATGATDNAAGCAIMMETMRILKALDLSLDRTVRMGLWDGEEQAYYGSRAYVASNFGDPVTMRLLPAHERFSAYYNIDNGGGKLRGVFLQSNDMARPIFESWLAPFRDQGVSIVTIRDTFGTDHLAFDAVGLPGFQFVQDPLEYSSRTHHSDLDTVDHLQPGDLMQAAAILATVVYHTANRDELMPRKPLPKPLPEKVPVPEILEY